MCLPYSANISSLGVVGHATLWPEADVHLCHLCTEQGAGPRSRLLLATARGSAGQTAAGLHQQQQQVAACLDEQ